jgi:hypothetical protein
LIVSCWVIMPLRGNESSVIVDMGSERGLVIVKLGLEISKG